MKKIVSALVSAVTLVAIVFVAIFGTKPQGIVPKVYIETLTVLPSDNSQYVKGDETKPDSMMLVYDASGEVEYDGVYYMPYIFKTEILPENATDRSFSYYVDDLSKTYMDFPPNSDSASKRGAFLIKKTTNRQFAVVDVHCRPLDGGKAKVSTLRVVIDYRPIFSEAADELPESELHA